MSKVRVMLWVGLVGMNLIAVGLAQYPESSATCRDTTGQTCGYLGGEQCFLQGSGSCTGCIGGGSLSDTSCVIVQGGSGCNTGTSNVYCGSSGPGTCSGTNCMITLDGSYCTAVSSDCT